MVSLDYNRSDEFLEITVRDGTGRKIETLECSRSNHKKYKHIMDYLRDKYGFEPIIEIEKQKEEQIDWFA